MLEEFTNVKIFSKEVNETFLYSAKISGKSNFISSSHVIIAILKNNPYIVKKLFKLNKTNTEIFYQKINIIIDKFKMNIIKKNDKLTISDSLKLIIEKAFDNVDKDNLLTNEDLVFAIQYYSNSSGNRIIENARRYFKNKI
jgi:ATP-dependent Clp protease ATP-binding subunit ClpA